MNEAAGEKMNKAIVAYIDILGGKNLIKYDAASFRKKCQDIYVQKNNILAQKFTKNEFFNNIETKTFSDNFCAVLRIENENNLFPPIAQMIAHIQFLQQAALAKYGFLLRGAIGYGDIDLSPELISGQVLVDCVLAEENVAFFPRVILLDSIIENLTAEQLKTFRNYGDFLRTDNDSCFFVNYLNLSLTAGAEKDPSKIAMMLSRWIEIAYQIAAGVFKNNKKELLRHRQKWLWALYLFSKIHQNFDSSFGIMKWDPFLRKIVISSKLSQALKDVEKNIVAENRIDFSDILEIHDEIVTNVTSDSACEEKNEK